MWSKSESKDRHPHPGTKPHERPSFKEKETKKNPLCYPEQEPESTTVRDSSREPKKLPPPGPTAGPFIRRLCAASPCAPRPMSGSSVWVSGTCYHLQMTIQSPQGYRGCRMGARVSQGPCHPQSGTDELSGGHPRWNRPLVHSWRSKMRNQPAPVATNYNVPVT